jgi:hypothetical protein
MDVDLVEDAPAAQQVAGAPEYDDSYVPIRLNCFLD